MALHPMFWGGGFTWGNTGSFTYDEANTQTDTLVFTDNDAQLTITNTSLELLKSLNGIIHNSNATVGGSWTVTGSDGTSFKVWRMLAPSQVEGYLLFTQDLTDGVTYSLSNFSLGDPMPYAQIAQQTTPCFCAGTWIDTPAGARRVETLCVGDLVRTRHHGPQTIRWIGRRSVKLAPYFPEDKLRPIKISIGALGQGLPREPLRLSRQHRVLVSSPINQRMFGTQDSLIAAVKLTDLPGIHIDTDCTEVTYIHLLFDQHEVIFANGAPCESLHTGPEAIKSISPAARAELFAIFPELMTAPNQRRLAALCPENRQQRQLIARHKKNKKPLLCL
ncbi:Hint domain-containing protein [Planktomarina temperata]|nr:Hint domain-containing protein [Planktomarina temperata]MDC1233947.1 Hint domain-containing protein [Planktomarina temperata]